MSNSRSVAETSEGLVGSGVRGRGIRGGLIRGEEGEEEVVIGVDHLVDRGRRT